MEIIKTAINLIITHRRDFINTIESAEIAGKVISEKTYSDKFTTLNSVKIEYGAFEVLRVEHIQENGVHYFEYSIYDAMRDRNVAYETRYGFDLSIICDIVRR